MAYYEYFMSLWGKETFSNAALNFHLKISMSVAGSRNSSLDAESVEFFKEFRNYLLKMCIKLSQEK